MYWHVWGVIPQLSAFSSGLLSLVTFFWSQLFPFCMGGPLKLSLGMWFVYMYRLSVPQIMVEKLEEHVCTETKREKSYMVCSYIRFIWVLREIVFVHLYVQYLSLTCFKNCKLLNDDIAWTLLNTVLNVLYVWPQIRISKVVRVQVTYVFSSVYMNGKLHGRLAVLNVLQILYIFLFSTLHLVWKHEWRHPFDVTV